MKKLGIILAVLVGAVFAKNVKADICAFITEKNALQAVEILKKQHDIIHYCEPCTNAKRHPETVNKVSYNKINEKNFEVLLNGKNIDLAYIYIKKSNSYENLAYLSGCDDAKKYNIQATRKEFPIIQEMTKEDISQKSKNGAQEALKNCMNTAFVKENPTTYDSLIASKKANDCLVEAIIKEIKKGFEPKEQAEMIQSLKQSRKAVFAFYDKIYNSNKYCITQCGAMAQFFPYEDETKLLQQMLERLIFLNLAKNGY